MELNNRGANKNIRWWLSTKIMFDYFSFLSFVQRLLCRASIIFLCGYCAIILLAQ